MTTTDRPEKERVAYCQNCGKPLTAESARRVGQAVYCEPCLVAKVAAGESSRTVTGSSDPASTYGFSAASAGFPYESHGAIPPPAPPGAPNPGLAALLGFIPGVGAFYNGQYAKGVVHLVVFAILTTLSDRNGIFGLFVAGWIFYQVIEAHHTARARRDGTPLPNPFGLNDIGERLGFGRAWPGSAPPPSGPVPSATAPPAAGPAHGYVPPSTVYTPPTSGYSGNVPPQAAWGAAYESYGDPSTGGQPGISFVPPPMAGSQVPVGAIILIGLGLVFLLANNGLLRGFPVHRLIPFLLIGVGVWIFVRKMTETGASLAGDGSPAYRLRLFRAARGPVWIVLVGLLFFLDTFNILSWGRSWPLFIIVGGLMTFFERTAYAGSIPPYSYAPPVPPPVAGPDITQGRAPIVAASPEQEGGN